MDAHRVVIVAFAGVQPLDLVGPHEVFSGAQRLLGGREAAAGYEVTVAGPKAGVVEGDSGLALVGTGMLADVDGPIGTLVVPGGSDVWTSAGVTAGIDLSLALVEEDHGPEVAQTVARWLVMFLRRPGGQSQFAAPVWERPARRDAIRDVQDHIHAAPGDDLSIPALARRASLSPRHFARLFAAELGESPGRYVERTRVEHARRLLEQGDLTLASVALRSGFGSTETLRRTFHRHVGIPPADYRARFSLRPPPR